MGGGGPRPAVLAAPAILAIASVRDMIAFPFSDARDRAAGLPSDIPMHPRPAVGHAVRRALIARGLPG